jgi:plasmid stability protein
METIHIDGIDDGIVAAIQSRAERHHRTFDEEVRSILAEAALSQPSERGMVAARIRSKTRKLSPDAESVKVIRELRNR